MLTKQAQGIQTRAFSFGTFLFPSNISCYLVLIYHYQLFFLGFSGLFQRSIFQALWKRHTGPDFLFNELESLNFG